MAQKISQSSSKQKEGNSDVQPLFTDMNSPSIDRAGYLMSLSCGHNGRPNELETAILISHLEAAKFIRVPPKKLNEDDYASAQMSLVSSTKKRKLSSPRLLPSNSKKNSANKTPLNSAKDKSANLLQPQKIQIKTMNVDADSLSISSSNSRSGQRKNEKIEKELSETEKMNQSMKTPSFEVKSSADSSSSNNNDE